MSDDPYPEHTKLKQIAHLSQACGEFIDWLEGQGISLCRVDEDVSRHYWPIHTSTTRLLADHFGIDLDQIEVEKRQMIEAMREANDD